MLYSLIGCYILIEGYRGDNERRLLRVDSIRDTHSKQELIKLRTYQDNPITRSQHLFTCYDPLRKETRSYYFSHMEGLRPLNWWKRQLYYLRVWMGWQEVYGATWQKQ
jgi:hypothetical protein